MKLESRSYLQYRLIYSKSWLEIVMELKISGETYRLNSLYSTMCSRFNMQEGLLSVCMIIIIIYMGCNSASEKYKTVTQDSKQQGNRGDQISP